MARASAVITKNNKVLLIHRKKEGEEYWVFPGGLIEKGETSEEAIKREVVEETGHKVTSCKFGFDYIDEKGNSHPVFYCEVENGSPRLGGPEAEKHSEEDWYHPEWIEIKKAVGLNVYPEAGKKLLKDMENIKNYPHTFTTKKGKKITIRLPEKEDVKGLTKFINKLVEEDVPILMNKKVTEKEEGDYLKGVINGIENKMRINLFAFDGDKLIANLGVDKKPLRQEHVGNLGIAVDKDYRGEGVGTELLKRIIFLAKDYLKLKIVILSVFLVNKDAIKLYERLGFVPYGELPKGISYKGEFVGESYMYLEL